MMAICNETQNWLGMRDSNPRSRNQNPLPYHLANPHWLVCITRGDYSKGASGTPVLFLFLLC
jgi:hypothetical protein